MTLKLLIKQTKLMLKFFPSSKILKKLEAENAALKQKNQELTKTNSELYWENTKLKQVETVISEKIREICEPKISGFLVASASQFMTIGGFKVAENNLKDSIDRIGKLEQCMKATDKVFFLSDKIEKLLQKLDLKN